MSWQNQALLCAEMESPDICPPLSLMKILQDPETKISDEHEALLYILHTLLIEKKFTPCNSFADWRKKHYYSISYTHPSTGDFRCHIKYLPLGKSAFVFAAVNTKEVAKLSLDWKSYIENYQQSDPYQLYKNVPYLSRTFNNVVILKILASLQDHAGMNPTFGLPALANELKLEILYKMDVASLVALAVVNHEFHDLIEHSSTWRYILSRDFPQKGKEAEGNWKQQYISEYMEKKKAEKLSKEEFKRQQEERKQAFYQQEEMKRALHNTRVFMSGTPYSYPFQMFRGPGSEFGMFPGEPPRPPSRRQDLAFMNLSRF